MPRSLRRHSRRAFSLVEVTLALGVIAFALVGIMALFPVAMKSAAESAAETRALFIAQRLMADLMAGSGTNDRTLRLGADATGLPVNLRTAGEWFYGYDAEGTPVGAASSGSWNSGDPAFAFLARVAVQPNPDNLSPDVSRVEVILSAPAGAPLARRTLYPFTTFVQTTPP